MKETRTITVSPAFHRCHPDKSKDYGVCEPRMLWTLWLGDDAISWELYTGWGMPNEAFAEACPECDSSRHRGGWPYVRNNDGSSAMAGAVDWHYSHPIWDDRPQPDNEHCRILDGPCWADVGFSLGDELFDLLRTQGDQAVWLKMRDLLLTTHAAEMARVGVSENSPNTETKP